MTRQARLRASIATMLAGAGSARRASADYRRMARNVPLKAVAYLTDADRKKNDARWYLRHVQDARTELGWLS